MRDEGESPTETSEAAAGDLGACLLLVVVSLLPHLSAVVPRLTYYFRDFTVTFYPLRLFQARELASGRLPFWNPYTHDGSFALPALYPLDLLHVLWPGPAAVSWLLTLHFPLAALAFYALSRSLGARPRGAFVSGSVYALGGLAISSLNLYVFLQALTLAPLVILSLRRAAARGERWIPWAALAVCVSVTTLALEFVAQGLLLGLALGWAACPRWRGAFRMTLAVALGLGLAAVPVALTLGVLRESVRGAGFPLSVVLGNEVHPVSLLQVLVPGLFGSLSSPVEVWWGTPFFSKGFPYFLSLYLGPLALALAAAGLASLDRLSRWLVLATVALALWYSLGARGGLAAAVASWPVARWFRFPSKAFFLPHMAVALLVGLGADRLRRQATWRGFGVTAGVGGFVALLLAAAVALAGKAVLGWCGIHPSVHSLAIPAVIREGLWTATLAFLGVGVARAVHLGRFARPRAVDMVGLLTVLDLARAGMGMNPQVDPAFFKPLPEMAALRLDELEGGRVFSYGLDYSPVFRDFLAHPRPGTGLWSFFINRQLLAPYSNIVDRVEVAEAKDVTAFVPRPPELAVEDYEPRSVASILPRLKNSAVSRIISLDPLDHPDLRLLSSVPAGPPTLRIRVYSLKPTWPRAYAACRVVLARTPTEALEGPLREGFDPAADVALEEAGEAACRQGAVRKLVAEPGREAFEIDLDGPGYLVTRDSYARGWKATVDGRPARVLRANGKHRAVPVPAGRHQVVLRYRPPGLGAGLLVMTLAGAGTLFLCIRPLRSEVGVPHG